MATQAKKAKDHAQKALDLIIEKYGCSDHSELDCTKMSDEDYRIYIEIDNSIQVLKEILFSESLEAEVLSK